MSLLVHPTRRASPKSERLGGRGFRLPLCITHLCTHTASAALVALLISGPTWDQNSLYRRIDSHRSPYHKLIPIFRHIGSLSLSMIPNVLAKLSHNSF